jgi:protein SHQ1
MTKILAAVPVIHVHDQIVMCKPMRSESEVVTLIGTLFQRKALSPGLVFWSWSPGHSSQDENSRIDNVHATGMIIPKFVLSQDEEFVYVTIKVPHIRVSAAELITEDCTFSFYCKPYLLKLQFPYPFKEEDEECKATYDPFNGNGTMVAHLPKLNVGQYFPDLDLTTSLLMTRRRDKVVADGTTGMGIEVIHSEDNLELEMVGMDEQTEALQDLPAALLSSNTVSYGFNNQHSNVFVNLRDELLDMTEIKHPDSIVAKYRTMLRISSENQQFDPERYLGDSEGGEDDPIFLEAMAYKPFHVLQWDSWKSNKVKNQADPTHGPREGISSETAQPVDPRVTAFARVGGFTEAEQEVLTNKLPRKEYLIDPHSNEEFALLLGLVDILFAFCYDHRVTLGEGTVESAHTIARLSCTFSWLEDYTYLLQRVGDAKEECIRQSILFSLRRSVIFPFLRVWKLARKVLADVARILFLGKRAILKCLLQLYLTFEHTDTHYLLNKIYVADYCVWLQSAALADETLQGFAKLYNVAKGSIEKMSQQGRELMGLFLPELEAWAAEEPEHDDSASESSGTDSDGDSDSTDCSSGDEGRAGSDSDREGSRSTERGAGVPLRATADLGDNPPMLSQTVEGEGETVNDQELRIPARLRDYDALQREDPQLAYLLPPADFDLTGAVGGNVAGSGAGAGEEGESATARDSGLEKMLILPKRKAEVPAAFDGVATKPKRVLIEDITPQSSEQPDNTRSGVDAEDSVVRKLLNMSLLSDQDKWLLNTDSVVE